MNWRRGLFRAWIVASVLWIACMGWYQYYSIPQAVMAKMLTTTKWNDIEQDLYFQSLPIDNKMNIAGQYFDQRVAPVYFTNNHTPEELKDIREQFIDQKVLHVSPELSGKAGEKYIQDLIISQRTYISKSIAIVFFPPFLVSLIFAIGLWVRHGFKAETHNKESHA